MLERKRNRLEGFDYSQDNLYFVTSCVQDRICCFGEIKNQKMMLNEYGIIAQNQWDWLGNQYSYVGTGCNLSLHYRDEKTMRKIKSLSELMGAYKTTTSKQIHLLGFTTFSWQRSFHDHIIRNEQAYENISAYIQNNPVKWKEDTFHEI